MLFTPVIDTKSPYCGPTAIALLTGAPTSVIVRMIQRKRKGWGNRPVKGTYTWEVLYILKRLGCKVQEFKSPEKTFSKFVEDTSTVGRAFLVNVTGHWMVSYRGLFGDSTWQIPTPIKDYDRGARRVRRAWIVTAPSAPKLPEEKPPTERAPKVKPDVKVVRATKIASDIKRWERKEKLAKTKLKKLRGQLRRYEKLNVIAATQ